jgi:hypothetical protein
MSRRAITALAAAIVAAGVVTGAVLVLSGGEDDSGFSVRPAAVPPLETEPVAQT